jgi:hypothetical protein
LAKTQEVGIGNRILRRTGVPMVVGLLALGTLAGAREAWAGGILITASGGTVTGSDPYYFYEFDVSLAPGFRWFPNDYLTIETLPRITPANPPLGQAGNNPNLPSPGATAGYSGPYKFALPTITLTDRSSPFASNVEWLNTTNATITAGSDGLFLGSFFVYTRLPLISLPTTLTYIAKSHGPNGNPYFQGPGGNTPPVTIALASVPEPSAFVLCLSGTGFLSLFLFLFRRRRGLFPCPAAFHLNSITARD